MRFAASLILFFVFASADAHILQRRNDLRNTSGLRGAQSEQAQQALTETIRSIETGLRTSTTTPFADRLAPSLQVGLPNLGRGQYSANQALQLIAGFLKQRPVRSLVMERIESAVPAPYAFGTLVTGGPSGQDTLRLYVAFVMNESRWSVSHFSLY